MLIECAILVLVMALCFRYYSRTVDNFNEAAIKGKRVVVTGASSGIGEQIAYHYARRGARLLITSRTEANLERVVSLCKQLGAQDASYIPLDMGDPIHTKHLIDEAKLRLGGLDHLILNHITHTPMELWNVPEMEKNLAQSIEVNFNSYVRLATYSTAMLAESQGSIAVVSSVLGLISMPFSGTYCAAKFAVHGFFDSLRLEFELQKLNVSVGIFVLGQINTSAAKNVASRLMDVDNLYLTSAEDAAYRIMTGTTNRERRVYYPLSAHFFRGWRDFLPGVVDRLVMRMYNADELAEVMKKSS
ncbi:corticosteroid 11-beta-dehydrogenase isozyme 1-like [Asterias rubens]|uniref:corticosteroid 11-beta-dehydrogenase isozyme 1-like n=1 Tax=Asterias rubens TaxID=7604 RepID=UPI00145516AA|nr:corticosteroid 11-beta-dehydrogenase isozyme 1-like [Asterias rubens]